MNKRLSLAILCAICICIIEPSNAARIGGLAGFGHYWAEGNSVSGLAFSGHFDIAGRNFIVSPTINFWTGNEAGESIADLTPTIALKYSLFSTAVTYVPFIGFEPELHILSGHGESEIYFGFSGLGGLIVNFSEYLQVPIQTSYGLIFGEETTLHTLTAKIGVTTNF